MAKCECCGHDVDAQVMNNYSAVDQIREAQEALEKIAELNPERDSEEGVNEWGESDCFRQAQEIARRWLQETGPDRAKEGK